VGNGSRVNFCSIATHGRISVSPHACVSALGERLQLALEGLALQHQLAVLARSAKRPHLSPVDRCVGRVIHGVVALAGSPHDCATGHSTTLVPTRVAAPPTVVARAEAARTACRRHGDACTHPFGWARRMSCGVPRASRANWRPSAYGSHAQALQSLWLDGLVRRRRHGAPSRAVMPPRLSPEERMRSSPPSSGLVRSGDPCLPALAGLLDAERSAEVRPPGCRVPYTAELSGVCAQPPGSSSRDSCPRP
jgi:hypothetical protein